MDDTGRNKEDYRVSDQNISNILFFVNVYLLANIIAITGLRLIIIAAKLCAYY